MVEAADSSDYAAELPGSAGVAFGWVVQASDFAVDLKGFAAAAAAAAEGTAASGSGRGAGSGGWELRTGRGGVRCRFSCLGLGLSLRWNLALG